MAVAFSEPCLLDCPGRCSLFVLRGSGASPPALDASTLALFAGITGLVGLVLALLVTEEIELAQA